MSVFDVPLRALHGGELDRSLLEGKAVLVVNVASRCGLTPQYEGLERLQRRYATEGRFTVLGVPCNQFRAQEPGSAEEIETFCSTTYGVTFPLTEKLDVNGQERHPLFDRLVTAPDHEGVTADVRWNFEKFLVSADGRVVGRFAPRVDPEDDAVIRAIEGALGDARRPTSDPVGWR